MIHLKSMCLIHNHCHLQMMDESEIASVTEHFELTEADIIQQVSDSHIEEISDSFCEKWRSLPPYLEMEAIVAKDIDRDHPGEECEKRCSFLKKWKKMRGLKATYKSLVHALLKAKSREEAEGVCKLLKKSISTPHQPDSSESLSTEKKIDTKGACTYIYLIITHALTKIKFYVETPVTV